MTEDWSVIAGQVFVLVFLGMCSPFGVVLIVLGMEAWENVRAWFIRKMTADVSAR